MDKLSEDQKLQLLENYNTTKTKRHEKYMRSKQIKQDNTDDDIVTKILSRKTGVKILQKIQKKVNVSNDQYDKLVKQYADALNVIDRLKQDNERLQCAIETLEVENVKFLVSNINFVANAFLYSDDDIA